MQQYKPGDWVRFAQDGRIKTAVVQYAQSRSGGGQSLFTDDGYITSERVLESRSVPPKVLEDVRGAVTSAQAFYFSDGNQSVCPARIELIIKRDSLEAVRRLLAWLGGGEA